MKFFDYMYNFRQMCYNKWIGITFNKTCAELAVTYSSLDNTKVVDCIQKSFDKYDSYQMTPNSLLHEDLQLKKTLGVFLSPAIVINNRTSYRGTPTGSNVLESVCAGMLKKPDVCYEQSDFRRPNPEASKGMSWGTIFLILSIILVANLAVYLVCRRYISKKIMERLETTDINHRINTVVTSYLALKENK